MNAQRLVDMAFADLDTVEAWLRRFPHLTVDRRGDALFCRQAGGFVSGFSPLAPIDAAIALALIVIGPFWSYAIPTLISDVEKAINIRRNAQCSTLP